ncbi:hypothetical protein ACLQ25_21620 [Micromonospora sp. DT44]|uniref:hypothetical protein n=1 Tax=Micromonospora sp. DT44 TaxID=3393439 RepID=UPI003CE73B56
MRRAKWLLPAGDEPFDPVGLGSATRYGRHGGWLLANPTAHANQPADEVAEENRAFWALLDNPSGDKPTTEGNSR